MARNHEDQNAVRQYLLRQLSDNEQRTIEQRLLSDDELFEELDIVEDELIDEYLAGDFSEDERKAFERSFLVAPERRQKLRFAEALKRQMSTSKAEEDVTKPDWFSQLVKWLRQYGFVSPVLVTASILIVAGLGFAIWRGVFYQSDVDKGLVALNSAYREQRPTETRITKFGYAPYSVTRGTGSDKVDGLERQKAERYLLDAVHDYPGPKSFHALGKFYLAGKDFDKAIAQFEQAAKGDPNNAQIYSDLGAALLELGKLELEKEIRSSQLGSGYWTEGPGTQS